MVQIALRCSTGRDERGHLPYARLGTQYDDFVQLLVRVSRVAIHYYCALGPEDRDSHDIRGDVRDLVCLMERHISMCNESKHSYHAPEFSSTWCWQLCRLVRRDVKLVPLRLLEGLEKLRLEGQIHPSEQGLLSTLRMVFNNRSSATVVRIVVELSASVLLSIPGQSGKTSGR
jgi:hypothetical protein